MQVGDGNAKLKGRSLLQVFRQGEIYREQLVVLEG